MTKRVDEANSQIRIVAPKDDYAIYELVRLVVYNHRSENFVLLKEIESGERFIIEMNTLEPHLDYSFKLQVKRDSRWTDYRRYERLVNEKTTPEGIKYIYFPEPESTYLIVVFQAINVKPSYNYIKTLSGVRAHRLYIKDDYGSDTATHTSYYLGQNRTFKIAEATQLLICQTVESLGIKPKDCIFAGSSKGGFAALFHGYRFGAGYVLPGGPQVLLGDFLNSKSTSSIHPPILRYLSGDIDASCVEWANNVLFNQLLEAKKPYPQVLVHVGIGDTHYKYHVVPLVEFADSHSINGIELDIVDYATHEELAVHYPIFLLHEVNLIINAHINNDTIF